MSRYRLQPTPAQEKALLEHCTHARFVWNLCVEQESHYRPGRGQMPGYVRRCRQLTEARAEQPWLAAGPVVVQQQAIRDHAQAMANYFAGTHKQPMRRKADRDEGFRITHQSCGVETLDFRPGRKRRSPRYGRHLIVIGRFYPSSRTCSACGHLLASLSLNTRHWTCPSCGTRHDRDVNAAKNILAAGLAVGAGNGADACGADVRPQGTSLRQSAVKQEPPGASPGIPVLQGRE